MQEHFQLQHVGQLYMGEVTKSVGNLSKNLVTLKTQCWPWSYITNHKPCFGVQASGSLAVGVFSVFSTILLSFTFFFYYHNFTNLKYEQAIRNYFSLFIKCIQPQYQKTLDSVKCN